jgi:hypothetical protein
MQLSFDPFDPSRKNGFLVEWRVPPRTAMSAALDAAQQHIVAKHGGGIAVRQSCSLSDNAHITLIELALADPAALSTALQVVRDFQEKDLPALIAALAKEAGLDPSTTNGGAQVVTQLQLDRLQDFRFNTFFISLKGPGVKFLTLLTDRLHARLHAAGGLVPTAKPRRELVCHITIGRLQQGLDANGAADWYKALMADPAFVFDDVADPGEIVFAAKRAPSESAPPVICNIFPVVAVAPAKKLANDGDDDA